MYVIPSIDLQNGRCVRLRQGKFDAVTEYDYDPVKYALSCAQAGFSWLHVVDLDGCVQGHPVNAGLISKIAATPGLNVQAGGGIRNRDAVMAYLEAGVQRVVIGSQAFRDPEQTISWARQFGPASIVIAADVRISNGEPQPVVDGWRSDADSDLYAALDLFGQAGITQVLCTEVSRDGMLGGPATELYQKLCQRYPALSIQASGGVTDKSDLNALEQTGVSAAIIGKSLMDGVMQPQEILKWSRAG